MSFMIRELGDTCQNCYESLTELKEKYNWPGRRAQLLYHFILKSPGEICNKESWLDTAPKHKSHNTYLRHDVNKTPQDQRYHVG